jgi:hypothetical protein
MVPDSVDVIAETDQLWVSRTHCFQQSMGQNHTESSRRSPEQPVLGLTFVTLGVTDLARATRFYGTGLGLRQLKSLAAVSFFDLGSVRLALYRRDLLAGDTGVTVEQSAGSGVALGYNVESRLEVDDLLGRVEKSGGRVLRRPGPTSWGGYAGYFADPDGFLWELVWNPNLSSIAAPSGSP